MQHADIIIIAWIQFLLLIIQSTFQFVYSFNSEKWPRLILIQWLDNLWIIMLSIWFSFTKPHPKCHIQSYYIRIKVLVWDHQNWPVYGIYSNRGGHISGKILWSNGQASNLIHAKRNRYIELNTIIQRSRLAKFYCISVEGSEVAFASFFGAPGINYGLHNIRSACTHDNI